MEAFLNNLVLYSTPIIWTIFVTFTFIGKALLKKHEYNVTYMNVSFSDYRNLKKITIANPKLGVVYQGLLISTIGVALSFILFIITMIIY